MRYRRQPVQNGEGLGSSQPAPHGQTNSMWSMFPIVSGEHLSTTLQFCCSTTVFICRSRNRQFHVTLDLIYVGPFLAGRSYLNESVILDATFVIGPGQHYSGWNGFRHHR